MHAPACLACLTSGECLHAPPPLPPPLPCTQTARTRVLSQVGSLTDARELASAIVRSCLAGDPPALLTIGNQSVNQVRVGGGMGGGTGRVWGVVAWSEGSQVPVRRGGVRRGRGVHGECARSLAGHRSSSPLSCLHLERRPGALLPLPAPLPPPHSLRNLLAARRR